VGKVRIRISGTGLSAATFRVDEFLLGYTKLGQSVGYQDGAVWINTISGTAGTVAFTNGTADNPVDNLPDALTLLSAIGLNRIQVAQGSSLQFVQTMNNLEINGLDYIIDLNGQQVDNSTITGAVLTGTCTGNGGSLLLERCKLGDVTLPEVAWVGCAIAGTITASETGTYFSDRCASAVAGTAAPTFDFGAAVGNTAFNLRHYSGGIEIENMKAGDTMSLEGAGQLIINANCTGGIVAIRGSFTVTDNAGGVVTLSDNARYDRSDRVITAGTAQGSGGNGNQIVLQSTASAIDGAYDPALIFLTHGTGAGQSRLVLGYNGTTKTCTVDRDWKVNPSTDTQYVISAHPGREHVNEGLAQGGTTTTITLNALADSNNNVYNDQVIFLRSGTGQDQAAIINAYNGTTKVATIVGAWAGDTPDTTTGYAILPTGLSRGDAVGSGGDQVSVFVYSDVGETQPIVGAQVWITTDAAGNNFNAGSLYTDDNGQVTFLLTAGETYYKWVRAAGYNPVLGDSFVAVAD
jgi:hypothetical protein